MPVETIAEPSLTDAHAANAPRWPARAALVTAPFLPARTAERTQQVRLVKAWGIHLLTCVLAAIVLLIFAIAVLVIGTDPSPSVAEAWHRLLQEVSNDAARHPLEFWAGLGGIIAGIEVGFVVLALLVGLWGARVEPLRASVANTLRRTWLHTPHALWCVVLGCLIAFCVYRSKVQWRQTHVSSFAPPTALKAPPRTATQQQKAAYAAQMQKYWTEYQRAMEASRSLEPFYVRYDDELVGIVSLVLSTWFLWGLMRAVGAPRDVEQKPGPPLCDFCGYNLTTMPMEARCPECGEPVLASLGPQVRPGAPWQDRRRIGRVTAYLRTLSLAIFRPSTLGRRIRLYQPGTDHRPLLGLHCLFLGVLGMLMPIIFMVWSRGGRPIDLQREFFREGVFVGFAVGGITLGALLLSAGLIGVICSLHARRNLLPAAAQIVSYLSGFVVLGILFGFLNVFVLDNWSRELTDLAQQFHLTNFLLAIMLFILPNLAWIVWTQSALARGISAARYANR